MPEAPLCVVIAARVVDNFGDAGVAWRLARQLAHDHACDVTLWIDDAGVLARFVPGADAAGAVVDGVRIRQLPARDALAPAPDPWPQACIEAFGCGLPAGWLDAMEAAPAAPVWINLEYLSAEDWVEGVHGLPSPHPRRKLVRWFFYPGFTRRTGGLLRERNLFAERDAFRADRRHRARMWTEAGTASPPDDALTVSLFCYPQAAVTALLEAWARGPQPVHALVPDDVASAALAAFLGHVPPPRTLHAIGALTLAVVPFVDQPAFDRRLWSCDFAIVRGEDSFVRAQWAGRPFAWHIYPQAEGAHRVKLDAFLARYTAELELPATDALAAFTRAFAEDDGASAARSWPALQHSLPALEAHAVRWSAALAEIPELATELVRFARSRL
jgi:uncharacterized repeat protein (TIGR03837 family)